MLNKNNERELVYVVQVEKIESMEGYDNLALAHINGWNCVTGKNDFKEGDLAVYFEIDSKLPEKSPFSDSDAIVRYKYKIKTQRFGRGGVPYISQGLIMHPKDLGLEGKVKLGDFLTKELSVTYYEAEDNARKADNNKYMSMQARHKKFFKTRLGKWLMKREWGRKLCFFFMGKKKDKKTDWPNWVVKTDEERIQNCFNQLKKTDADTIFTETEKVDGTSTTFTMRQNKPKKRVAYICSRNVVYDKPEKENKNFYKNTDGNVYVEMFNHYNIEEVLNFILNSNKDLEYVTLQGETYGGNIQKRDYSTNGKHYMKLFNFIYKLNGEAPVRLNPYEGTDAVQKINKALGRGENAENALVWVDILGETKLLETCDDMLAMAAGASKIDGKPREGMVLRSQDGSVSFKIVDNSYLIHYHS